MRCGFIQVYAYNLETGEKHTANSEHNLAFLARLSVGSAVWEERGEWDTAREEYQTVTKHIGHVEAGDFGNQFKRTARFN